MKTILLGLTIALMNFFAAECSAQQASKLPKKMPENAEISFHKSAGMIYAFTNIVIANQTMTIEEKNGDEKQARKWSVKIAPEEQENLYKIFVENSFDKIKNEEPKGIVYDAGSEGVSLDLGAASCSVSYGPNSPLSAANQKRYQTIANAINALRSKYEAKSQKTADAYFAVLNLSQEHFNIFFKNASPATLSDKEINSVKDILKKAVDEYNSKQREEFRIAKLEEYKFQLVALFNAKGDKEVWVNGFCTDFDKDWRTEIIGVDDGGKCFFNLYVNLTKQTFDRFSVNGEA